MAFGPRPPGDLRQGQQKLCPTVPVPGAGRQALRRCAHGRAAGGSSGTPFRDSCQRLLPLKPDTHNGSYPHSPVPRSQDRGYA